MYSILRRKNFRFSYDKDTNLFKISENSRSCFFSDTKRGFSIYRNGIDHRENFLFSSYCLQNIKFNSHDIIIDCGANSGDLFLKLNKFIDSGNYIAVEPNPSDFKILSLNVPKESILINKALGNVNSKLSFYVSTSSGDSSLIEPVKYDDIIKVDVVRLDDLLLDLKKTKIKLLKLEAEGFEPEILQGSNEVLDKIEYIGIDGSPERGKKNDTTIEYAIDFLTSKGFKVIASNINQKFAKALFKNLNFYTDKI